AIAPVPWRALPRRCVDTRRAAVRTPDGGLPDRAAARALVRRTTGSRGTTRARATRRHGLAVARHRDVPARRPAAESGSRVDGPLAGVALAVSRSRGRRSRSCAPRLPQDTRPG